MAETFRRSKIEKFVKMLEEELPDLEESYRDSGPYGMGLYYDGMLTTQKHIINKLKRTFKLKEEQNK